MFEKIRGVVFVDPRLAAAAITSVQTDRLTEELQLVSLTGIQFPQSTHIIPP